jgi:hypothetical protein
MSYPNDLLEQARHLANREPKRPKQASLRRAVSTAYYALFHLLSIELAKNWKRVEERSTVARMLDHGPMARVCAAKREELNKHFATRPVASRQLTVLRHIHAIANTFEQMHQQRQIADYDNSGKWARTDVLEKLESVQAAFESWREIHDEPEAQRFIVTLLLRERR